MSMLDSILIEGLSVSATIGVLDWERQIKQTLVFELELSCTTEVAAKSDNVADALDYAAVAQRIIDITEASEFQLLEALAEEIVQTLLCDFPTNKIRLKVTKPGAVRGANSVGLVINREI